MIVVQGSTLISPIRIVNSCLQLLYRVHFNMIFTRTVIKVTETISPVNGKTAAPRSCANLFKPPLAQGHNMVQFRTILTMPSRQWLMVRWQTSVSIAKNLRPNQLFLVTPFLCHEYLNFQALSVTQIHHAFLESSKLSYINTFFFMPQIFRPLIRVCQHSVCGLRSSCSKSEMNTRKVITRGCSKS